MGQRSRAAWLLAPVALFLFGSAGASALAYPTMSTGVTTTVTGTLALGAAGGQQGSIAAPLAMSTPGRCAPPVEGLRLTLTSPSGRVVAVRDLSLSQVTSNALGGYAILWPESLEAVLAAAGERPAQWSRYTATVHCPRAGATEQSWQAPLWFTSEWTYQTTPPSKGVTGAAAAWSAAEATVSSRSGSAGVVVAPASTAPLGLQLSVLFTGIVSATTIPRVTPAGPVEPGTRLTCSRGSWAGSPARYAFQWRVNSLPVSGVSAAAFTADEASQGLVTCVVTATSAVNSASSESAPVVVEWPAMNATVAPSITGKVQVSRTVTCDPGTWSRPVRSIGYAWTVNGAAVAGATASSFTIPASAVGKSLACSVTATSDKGRTGTATTPGAAVLRLTTMDNVARPTITGIVATNQTVTCLPGGWSEPIDTVAYSWRLDGTAISGATSNKYRLAVSAAGRSLTCAVTATNADGVSGTATTAAATVQEKTYFANTAPPAITGTVQAGQTVTCSRGTWSRAVDTVRFTWRLDGNAVSGVTTATYALPGSAAGKALTCVVRATSVDGATATATSPSPIVADPPPITVTQRPRIVGAVDAGETVTCNPGKWSQSVSTTTIRWRLGGVDIAGATKNTYLIPDTAIGSALSCSVNVTGALGQTGTATSDAVTVKDLPPMTSTAAPTITGTVQVGVAVTCTPGSWSLAISKTSFAWQIDGTAIAGATEAGLTIPASAAGKILTCAVTATAGSGQKGTASTAGRRVLQGPALTTPDVPTITGTATVGQTLRAQGPTYRPAATTVTYTWYRDNQVIAGATGATYRLVAADRGRTITVRSVGSASGYANSQLSKPSAGRRVS